jgi:S1-C subfamily serine protease
MERIVLKHLSGSKANQVEEFPLNHVKELVLGRDPSSTVKYDPDRDDLVGRQHAKISQDPNDPLQFNISDMNSRNGTFVNRQRIVGTSRINPGDVVQLGPGGPEFVFDLEPRPAGEAKTTRVATSPSSAPATRVAGTGGPSFPVTAQAPKSGVGKETVERIVSANVQQAKKSQGRTFLAVGGVVIILVVVVLGGVGGFLIWKYKSQASDEVAGLKKNLDEAKASDAANAAMKAPEVVKNFGGAVVKILVSWKLVSQAGDGLVYHQYRPFKLPGETEPKLRACYVRINDGTPNGKIEPFLTYTKNEWSVGIGGMHTGSGFAVSSDGFILTNRHVAAAWETSYHFPDSANEGVILAPQNGQWVPVALVPYAPDDWVPAQSKQDNISYTGRNDLLDVLLPNSERRLTAKLSAVSPRHDVALIKVDSPGTLPKVEINDNYDTITSGADAIVLGYPSISEPVYGVVKSQDMFNRETQAVEIPDPTVTNGNIGRVYKSQEGTTGIEKTTLSNIGDAYQLQINTTGPGNSGGPVFDDHGKVIAIFYAGARERAGTAVTFAVPIRYGRELMGVK